MPANPHSDSNAVAPRKKYEAPRLEVYGNIHQITQTLGTLAKKADGGGHVMSKTG